VGTTAGGASRLQRALVVLQASLSFVLLVGAGLFAQSLRRWSGARGGAPLHVFCQWLAA
jgi:hypothetical protein